MFDLHCETCDRTYLMGSRSWRRFENTDDGPVGEAVCPHGHVQSIEFRRPGRPGRPVPASRPGRTGRTGRPAAIDAAAGARDEAPAPEARLAG